MGNVSGVAARSQIYFDTIALSQRRSKVTMTEKCMKCQGHRVVHARFSDGADNPKTAGIEVGTRDGYFGIQMPRYLPFTSCYVCADCGFCEFRLGAEHLERLWDEYSPKP